MSVITLRDASPADSAAVLALNAESVHFLSPLDAARLAALSAAAAYFRVAVRDGAVVAFLLALREGAAYDSENYRWFAARHPAFLYVDRIVVSAAAQGQGLGRRLYDDLFAWARTHRFDRVVCEYDIAPPNPGSAAFHAGYGFRVVGRQRVAGGTKEVALCECVIR